ncbi:hypothetical protein IMSHALPRED_010123 [Imshaugia aleurites]|uniref:F-box domain-containing protein n=1 Tax=Imshaugia aleurites TaxID=172621 RepID=A0A8H3G5G9_9LECA|nr:hypothetical protein IMSHALPRED_010123 [Imshaugia aleurites]
MAIPVDATELRYLTYSRADICDRTIDTEYLQHDCPLDQTSSRSPSASKMQEATASLGRLDRLPLETTQNILSNLDLGTLTLLRSISRRTNLLVDSLPAYQKVVTHCPNGLRALLSTRAAQYFTAYDLYNALRAQDCFLCGRFGAFLYLLECQRCCWQCLTSSKNLLPITQASAQSLYRFDAQTLAKIPAALNIPGSYGPKHRRIFPRSGNGGVRVALVAYGAVKNALGTWQGREAMTEVYEKAKLETRIAFRGPVSEDFMRDMDCMNRDPAGYRAGYGLEPQRFMATVRFPTLMAGADAVEWGVSCLGCLEKAEDGDEERFWNEQYTIDGMVEHLEQCQKAKHSWTKDRVRELRRR